MLDYPNIGICHEFCYFVIWKDKHTEVRLGVSLFISVACRALGFKHGRLVDLSEINIGALSAMRWINIECDADDNDLEECERSNFDGECVAPGADALVIACHHGKRNQIQEKIVCGAVILAPALFSGFHFQA